MNDIIKEQLKKLKSPKILIIAGISGIVLILLSSLIGGKKEEASPLPSDSSITAEQYLTSLQNGITEIVKGITGSEKVKVVITLESGLKYSYADINEGSSADKSENGGESTSRESKKSYITVKKSDGGEQALLVTTEMPEIRGVAIVCEGGDIEEINEKIQNAVTAALNITAKRVFIAGGNN